VFLAHGWVGSRRRCRLRRSCVVADRCVVCSGDGAQQKGKQQKGKGKGKAGSGGAGGGPSGKAAAAGRSGEASTSSGGGSRPSTLQSASASLRSVAEDVAPTVLPSAEAASDTQQTAGGGKKEKERQRQRRMGEAREALQGAMEAMAMGARCVSPLWLMCIGRFCFLEPVVSIWAGGRRTHVSYVWVCSGESALAAVEEATAEAGKHGDRSEPLVAEPTTMIEQARAAQAERARPAAEAAAAAAVAAAVEAAERLRLEEQVATLTLVMRSAAMQLQAAQAQLGSSVVLPAAPAPDPGAEETLCVVCLDAPKDHIIIPCGHRCVCGACAEKLTKARSALCPFCRTPIKVV
jgi:hypothetical protein